MKNSYEISIVIPAYNVQEYILRCLESIKAQTFRNFEIIIIDDGSTDRKYYRKIYGKKSWAFLSI